MSERYRSIPGTGKQTKREQQDEIESIIARSIGKHLQGAKWTKARGRDVLQFVIRTSGETIDDQIPTAKTIRGAHLAVYSVDVEFRGEQTMVTVDCDF